MRFSVIIATLGRPDVLARTIESVARCDPAPSEIIVVDGDPGRSSEAATAGSRPFPVRYMTAHKGLPKQRNAGMDAATGDVLVFIDDDVRVPADTFAVLDTVYRDETVVGATARIIEPEAKRIGKKHSPVRRFLPGGGGADGTFTRYGYPRRLVDLDKERDIEFMHGSFMSARAAAARDVRFDEVLPGYALAEDEDFSYRLSRTGRVRFVPSLHVVHAKEGHGSRDARAFGRTVVVNRSYLFRKNFDATPLARLQFAMLILLFLGHRLVNREFAEAAGLIEGSVRAVRNPLLSAAQRSTRQDVKVAFVSSHARAGGSERYLAELIARLEPAETGPVFCLEGGPFVHELRQAGHDARVIPSTGRPLSIAGAALRLRRELRKERPSVAHANGIKAAFACLLAPRNVPVVWVKHDFSFDGRLANLVGARSDAIVGVSEASLAALPDKQRRRATVVHSGVRVPKIDRDQARRKLVAELGIEDTHRTIGLVGRLHPVKGHLDLVRAAELMVEDDPELHFVFVGGRDAAVPGHEEAVRKAAAGLGGRAHFLGHRDPVLEVMAGLDVGAMPSHRDGRADVEALPLTALELMAAGTPVVAYASGGIPEALGECGVLVPVGDVGRLAAALASVVADARELERMSACGRSRVQESFSVPSMVSAMRSVYSEIRPG